MLTALAVLGGFGLDLLLADPAWMPHPVVGMGRAIAALEKRLRCKQEVNKDGIHS